MYYVVFCFCLYPFDFFLATFKIALKEFDAITRQNQYYYKPHKTTATTKQHPTSAAAKNV